MASKIVVERRQSVGKWEFYAGYAYDEFSEKSAHVLSWAALSRALMTTRYVASRVVNVVENKRLVLFTLKRG